MIVEGEKVKIEIDFSYDKTSQRYSLKYGRSTIGTDEYWLFESIRKLYNDEILFLSKFELLAILRGTKGEVRETIG